MPRSVARWVSLLVGLAALSAAVTAAGMSQAGASRAEVAQESAAKRIVERLSGGRPSALHGVILGWTETKPDGAKGRRKARRYLAALRYPDRFRLEVRDPSAGALVYKRTSKGAWVGPAGGPFLATKAGGAGGYERVFSLLSLLMGWDLLEGQARVAGSKVHSTWKKAPVMRVVDSNGQPESLELGGTRYALRPSQTKKFPADVAATPERTGMKFRRCSINAEFEDSYFDPAATTAKKVRIGGERQNFLNPTLARVEAAWLLEVDAPDRWPDRLAKLDSLGRALHGLGQVPAGLPAYTTTGKMQVYFRPAKRKAKPQAPAGHKPQRRPAKLVAVLYGRGPWDTVRAPLEKRLAAFARQVGLEPGAVRHLPYVLPGETNTPGRETVLLVRAELDVR